MNLRTNEWICETIPPGARSFGTQVHNVITYVCLANQCWHHALAINNCFDAQISSIKIKLIT